MICNRCGNPDACEHHIIARGSCPGLWWDDPENKVALCAECHTKIHMGDKVVKAWLGLWLSKRGLTMDELRCRKTLNRGKKCHVQ